MCDLSMEVECIMTLNMKDAHTMVIAGNFHWHVQLLSLAMITGDLGHELCLPEHDAQAEPT